MFDTTINPSCLDGLSPIAIAVLSFASGLLFALTTFAQRYLKYLPLFRRLFPVLNSVSLDDRLEILCANFLGHDVGVAPELIRVTLPQDEAKAKNELTRRLLLAATQGPEEARSTVLNTIPYGK